MNRRNGFWLRLQENCAWLAGAVVLAGILWQLLELLLYKEIQHRRVDDIMALVWMGTIVAAYNRGYSHAYMDGWWDAQRWRDRHE